MFADMQGQIDNKASAGESAEAVFELMRELPEVLQNLGLPKFKD